MWMLAGRRDVESVARFVKRMRTFSDDGEIFHGAYGYRWRSHFGKDQIELVVKALKENPEDRRQVISMWDARADLARQGKDLPCNLEAAVQVNADGELDLTVFNRSNDIIWGALGANAVHFSILLEYLADRIGVPVGTYTQVSANMHAYMEPLNKVRHLAEAVDPLVPYTPENWDEYAARRAFVFPLDADLWEDDLVKFVDSEDWQETYKSPFFAYVAAPMMRAWHQYKAYDQLCTNDISFCDWRIAAEEWINRRLAKRAQDDGVRYE